MGRLGVVRIPGGRWRAYAGPVAVLLAATVTVALVRGGIRSDHHASPTAAPARASRHGKSEQPHQRRRTYVVRAGDTIGAISVRTGVAQARILALNPKVSPTALFIGERLRLS